MALLILKLDSFWLQSAVCVILRSVIANGLISAFSNVVPSFINTYVVNRNEFLNADGGLTLHPAEKTGYSFRRMGISQTCLL